MKARLNIKYLVATLVIAAVAAVVIAVAHNKPSNNNSAKLQIVAAENFWGSLVSQLAGDKASVTSIVSDPNADPHEYESNNATARAFASANYVIENGVGYDSWADKLLSANPESSRKVLNIGTLVGKKEGDNPHLWYNPAYVNEAVSQMEKDLISLRPADKSYFENQYSQLTNTLQPYQNRIVSIKHQFGGTQVAATEDIFAYLAQATGLDLISPPAFIEAVAEGNDPPADSVVQFQQQLQQNEPKVLVYNEQTVTPLTTSIKLLATQQNIPVIGVTETVQPPDTSFQDWMNAELINLENALNATKLGQ